MKVETLEIVYFGSNFFAGQYLSGEICLNTLQPIKTAHLRLKIKGKAQTQWSTHRGKTATAYMGEEVYIDDEITLNFSTSAISCDESPMLPIGAHRIAFEYALGEQLPSSFESAHGHIRYVCTATLKRPMLKFDVHVKKPFSVTAHEDLNTIADAREPIAVDESEELICCCSSRGLLSISVGLERRGFVSGELVPLHVEVRNDSRKDVDVLQLRLKQYISYYGDTTLAAFKGRYDVAKEVVRIDKPCCIASGQRQLMDNLKFQLPQLAPSLIGCELIDIRYGLKVSIGPYARVELPIIIGTVPVVSTTDDVESDYENVL